MRCLKQVGKHSWRFTASHPRSSFSGRDWLFCRCIRLFHWFQWVSQPSQILWDCTGKGTKSKELMVSHGKRNRRTSGMWKAICSSNCILILHKEMWARKYWDQGNPRFFFGGGGGGVSPQIFWWGVWPEPWNLYPISGQHGKSDRKSCASVSDTPS